MRMRTAAVWVLALVLLLAADRAWAAGSQKQVQATKTATKSPSDRGAQAGKGQPGEQITIDRVIERMRKDAETEKPYQFGTDVSVAIAEGKTVIFKCGKNPYGITEVLIGPSDLSQKVFSTIFLGKSGVMGASVNPFSKDGGYEGLLQQTACHFAVKWQSSARSRLA